MTWFIYLIEPLRNSIPHKIMTCDDRDPSWIDSSIRRLIQDKNQACKRFERNNNNSEHLKNFSFHSELTRGYY